jgi:peptidoglycan/LPS O-acetylase OafA/YrhL
MQIMSMQKLSAIVVDYRTPDLTKTYVRSSENNFDIIRLILAFIVFFVHSYDLSHSNDLESLTYFLSSKVAVESFFVISGFLIIMSYERSKTLSSYARKRIRRIYPAYMASLFFFAILLPIIECTSYGVYTSLSYMKYLAVNAVFLNFITPSIPGVFENNLIPAVNGAMWTIKIEVMFYVCVPVVAWLCKRSRPALILLLLYIIGFSYSVLMKNLNWTHAAILAKQLPGQLQFFASGMALYYFYDKIMASGRLCLGVVILGFSLHYTGVSDILYPASLALVLCFFAFCLPAINLSKIGDLSYGVYIVHFPILQALISLGMFRYSGWGGLLVAIVLVIFGGYLMWHLVEKRFLFKNSHYLAKPSQ